MNYAEVFEKIERLRVELGKHRNVDFSLGALYALDTLKDQLKQQERREEKGCFIVDW